MSWAFRAAAVLAGVASVACRPTPPAVDPHDPAITAVIDSLVRVTMAGAAEVDADRVLQAATKNGQLSFITGDVLLTGLEPMRERFRTTYAGLQRQKQELREKQIRVLSPDVAIAYAVGEGTYTDKAGWTSAPVGIGTTIVFVREDGQWRIVHAHQSIAP